MSRKRIVLLLIVLLLVVDQVVKIWVKTNMALDQSFTVFPNWFFIRFIENPGAAFGFQLGGSYGKLILSVFRLAAIAALGYYLAVLLRKKAPTGVLVGFTLIFAGAVGNVIDSAFYGLLFRSRPLPASRLFFPKEADMPVSCTARWLTCFISRFLAVCTPVGCLGWAVNRSSFSVRSLTWPTAIFPSELSTCCCSSANFSNKFLARKANFQKGGIRVVKGFPKAPAHNLPPRCHRIR